MNKEFIVDAIAKHKPITIEPTSPSAAVMILLIYDKEDLFLLLTKRTETLPTYAGDYSFPGGMREDNDNDFIITAQRETEEELNLSADLYSVIGQLDDFHDRFGNLVRPFVATISKSVFEKHYKNSVDEVASIYYFPIDELLKIKPDPTLELLTKRHPSYKYVNGDVFVWGLTASIMVQFSNIIFGLP